MSDSDNDSSTPIPGSGDILTDFQDLNFARTDKSILSRTTTLSATESKTTSKFMRVLDVILDQLHPMHFVITMGIGITSGILYNFPVSIIRKGSKYVGIVYFFINVFCFVLLHTLFILKYILLCSRSHVSFNSVLQDSGLNVFLGCEVMGFSTIINMIYFMKPNWYIFAYVLWWINVVLSIFAGWGISFLLFSVNKFKERDINATILLPVVTLTVVSSTGSLISQSLMNHPSFQLSSDIITFLLFGNAITLALFFIGVYFHRLFFFDLPPKPAVYTCFIPIGILGQGGWAIQLNYNNLGELVVNHTGLQLIKSSLSNEGLQAIEVVLKLSGIAIALFLNSLGICLTILSIMAVIHYGKPPIWTRSMWASTFPLGTIALSFNEMYSTTHITGFCVVGVIYSVALILITSYCIVCTIFFEIPYKQIYKVLK